MDMSIHIMKPEEQKYTFTQSRQLICQTGCIGHLRADLGSGKEFYSIWDDHYDELKTPEFKRELNEVINNLRFGPLYVDKHNCIIQDGDLLHYDDGSLEEVFTLEDGSKGHSITNPDFLKHHPDAEEKYTPLISDISCTGLRKLHHAEIDGLTNPDSRRNDAACGAIFSDRRLLFDFCHVSASASFGNQREWGIRVNTKEYSYLMRLNPNKGEYSIYCYCYRRDWLEQHLKQAERGIRFITPHYKELFRLKDGDQIRVITDQGEKNDRTVRYIDHYHLEVGGSTGKHLYHICEFAERMETLGNKVIPLRSSLPEKCYVYVEFTDEIGLVERGEQGYSPANIKPEGNVSKKKGAEYLNDALGVSKAQAAAMNAGSLFGWDTKAADPANYDDMGVLQKATAHDRGKAR